MFNSFNPRMAFACFCKMLNKEVKILSFMLRHQLLYFPNPLCQIPHTSPSESNARGRVREV